VTHPLFMIVQKHLSSILTMTNNRRAHCSIAMH